MATLAAPELNGARIQLKGSSEVWLMFHGKRHYIRSPGVYDALFSDVKLLELEQIEQIIRGQDLVDGTCLARSVDGGSIYLVTGYPADEIRKHLILSYEGFQDFGFDESKVVEVLPLILAGIPIGRDIRSAAE